MALGWINPNDYSFESLLLFEQFQIRIMLYSSGWRIDNEKWRRYMGVALYANPAVAWYLKKRCPECADIVDALMVDAKAETDPVVIRAAEVYVLSGVEDFVIYTTPERMDSACDFIYAWDKSRLFEMADFDSKTVLDCGSGSGRLAFAAAEKAKFVVASEPVGTLREYLREKIARDGITNIKVCDGMIENLPFLDSTFDIVMSGHVIGDNFDVEIVEAERVCKPGGWVLDCPGDSKGSIKPDSELVVRGYEELYYHGSLGGDVYRYRKQILK
ncbi:MAG: class I SAM-dependent methyltransferase [Clostridium sp.]|nr:class I SAM-dependent methyltransferase [Clostridium sp.]